MANTATSVLEIARGEIGYNRYDDPETGTKYGRWYAKDHGSYYGQTGVPYCAMFVSWVFDQAGAKCAGLPSAYCPYIRNDALSAKATLSDKTTTQPGDVVLFDWDGDCVEDHVGIIEINCGSYVQTIEGNVSGCVARRTRSWGDITYIVRPSYATENQNGSSKPADAVDFDENPLLYDGYFGPLTTKYLQLRLRAHGYYPASEYLIDGDFGYYTKLELQKYLRTLGYYTTSFLIDGDFGKYSIMALQNYLKSIKVYWDEYGWAMVDGDWGSLTTIAIQRALNGNLF